MQNTLLVFLIGLLITVLNPFRSFADVNDEGLHKTMTVPWLFGKGGVIQQGKSNGDVDNDRSLHFVLEKFNGNNEAWPGIYCDVSKYDFTDVTGIYFVVRNPLAIPQDLQFEMKDAEGKGENRIFTIPSQSSRKLKIDFDELEGPQDISSLSKFTLYRTRPVFDHVFDLIEIGTIKESTKTTLLEYCQEAPKVGQ